MLSKKWFLGILIFALLLVAVPLLKKSNASYESSVQQEFNKYFPPFNKTITDNPYFEEQPQPTENPIEKTPEITSESPWFEVYDKYILVKEADCMKLENQNFVCIRKF